jgi:carbamoyltransferase
MNILGLFGPGPNPSAALLKGGQLVALIEEERLNRIKTSPDNLPVRSAAACLKKAGLSLDDLDGIAYGWNSPRYVAEVPAFFARMRGADAHRYPFNVLQEELRFNLYHPDRIRATLQLGLGALSRARRLPPITFYPHHLCHAASALYCSGFDEANILTLDGSGEEVTTLLCCGSRTGIEVLKQFELPHTLGGYYATFTEYLGFRPYQDEGKLMGLASYGRPSPALQDKLNHVIPFDPETGNFTVNPRMRYDGGHTYGARYTDDLVDLFGPPRGSERSALDAPYPDLAYAVQQRLEDIVLALARHLKARTGLGRFCLAGGVAMNCVMNGKLASQSFVDDIFVQPAASDNGAALGAALLMARERGVDASFRMTHLYYGPAYSNEQIEKALQEAKIDYARSADVARDTAQLLAKGRIIGWLQGPMEVGARALGNRSILASPLIREMKDRLNLEVKHREPWRPFCPSMKEELYRKYINATTPSPFMIMAFPACDEHKAAVPAVVHVDGTARPQTVSRRDNPRFWSLLDEFEKLTGHGILINTSFNVQGEPIVCSPQDALRCFGGTGIDVLVMGDFIARKAAIARLTS